MNNVLYMGEDMEVIACDIHLKDILRSGGTMRLIGESEGDCEFCKPAEPQIKHFTVHPDLFEHTAKLGINPVPYLIDVEENHD